MDADEGPELLRNRLTPSIQRPSCSTRRWEAVFDRTYDALLWKSVAMARNPNASAGRVETTDRRFP